MQSLMTVHSVVKLSFIKYKRTFSSVCEILEVQKLYALYKITRYLTQKNPLTQKKGFENYTTVLLRNRE